MRPVATERSFDGFGLKSGGLGSLANVLLLEIVLVLLVVDIEELSVVKGLDCAVVTAAL